mgnify:CR=1 FL=1
MKSTLSVLFAFAIVQLCAAQSGYTLTGTVYEESDDEVLEFATVYAPGTQLGGHADANGDYSIVFEAIPQQLVCKHIGYVSDTVYNLRSVWPASQTTFKMDFRLTEEGYGYGPLIIKAVPTQLKDGRLARKKKVVVTLDRHRP